jgi:non-heme chloroperoxidase
MGAMVILEFIRQFGQEDISSIVIVDQPPSDFAWPDYEFGGMSIKELGDMLEGLNDNQESVVESLVSDMLHLSKHEASKWMVKEILKVPPAIGASIFANQTLQDYRLHYDDIKIPCLVLFGSDPKLTPPDAGTYIANRVQNGKIHLFERSSHCPFVEEPKEFNKVLHEFVIQQ